MKLPVNYDNISYTERKLVREEYIKIQKNRCYHCGMPLADKPKNKVLNKKINRALFPVAFFKNSIHLHHDHYTGMTIGVVHNLCNAYLWQYKGE